MVACEAFDFQTPVFCEAVSTVMTYLFFGTFCPVELTSGCCVFVLPDCKPMLLTC